MKDIRGKILWVDDEINQLKPHILFLEEKGYVVSTLNNDHELFHVSLTQRYHFHFKKRFLYFINYND